MRQSAFGEPDMQNQQTVMVTKEILHPPWLPGYQAFAGLLLEVGG
jgi:hypothetical protein